MTLGLDYYNVITQFPDVCRELVKSQVLLGHKTFIISAVGDRRLKKVGGMEKYREEIDSFHIPSTETIIVFFDHEDEIPTLKYKICKEKGIDLFIDDRPETVEYLHQNGLMALLLPKPVRPEKGRDSEINNKK